MGRSRISMWPPPRLLPLLRAIFLLLPITIGGGVCLAQAPQQKKASAAAPADQQANGSLPAKWNEAVRTLAAKIALAAAPAHVLELDVRNISMLSPTEAAAIRQELENQLKDLHFRFTATSSVEVRVEVTFSDSTEGRIAVAAIRRANDQQIIVLPVPNERAFTERRQRESLTLTAELVREQPEKILDFAVFNYPPPLESTLLIVEPGRLVFYRSRGSEWELMRTMRISSSTPPGRDMQAMIKIDRNEIMLSNATCSGLLSNPEEVHCDSSEATRSWSSGPRGVPGRAGSVSTELSEKCDGGLIELVSGSGDWTQPDSIEGFEYAQAGIPAVPAGNTLNFEGPVMSLMSNGKGVIARVVVHNLRTENYEAYLVTATCSH
jgi:hypothetical protein